MSLMLARLVEALAALLALGVDGRRQQAEINL
jgi:hypothetical protein